MHGGKNNYKGEIDWGKVSLLLKIGIIGALINLAGDLLSGWSVRDTSRAGIEGFVSQYLTMSDKRIFWSAILGLIGAPVSVFGHFGIYTLIKPYSRKYAKLFGVGALGLFALGGAGVHMSSLASAFFYKYMTAADSETALAASIKFVWFFSLPLYIAFFVFWLIHTYAHIRAIAGAFSPYPRWCWVFSMPVGALLFRLKQDFETFGFLFESIATRDLRVYAEEIEGTVYYYTDTTGLEVDLIVELNDGRWGGIEVKLGENEVDKASANLMKLATLSTRKPAFLMILTNTRMAYQRSDGVYVIPLGCLKP